MPNYFQKPENALKRANEFINVGKKQSALDALYDVIKSKKHKTWQKIHEPIMDKYLELCVDLKKSHVAKEGLYQYKITCMQVNTKSLEDAVKKFLALGEEKTEAARKESHLQVDVDDLDVPDTPENVLMSAVSGEDSQDRSDRVILTPWLKFLWESYRQCLDLFKNNSTLEKLYHDVAQNAFRFCLKYSRKTEIKKLSDNLRTHLEHMQKNTTQQRAINLNNPESQSMHLETRLVQLDGTIQMELWQEAYKAVEDIHSLIVISKKQPKPSLVANYYQKLALIFHKSNSLLFHATTWHRLYHLYREQRKNMTEAELQKLAIRVVTATLAIPIPSLRNPNDNFLDVEDTSNDKHRRLASLLSLNTPPNRQQLVKDLQKYGILQLVPAELASLYNLMEVEFCPLTLGSASQPLLDVVASNQDTCMYVAVLKEIIVCKFITQVSQLYASITIDRFCQLIPFYERLVVQKVLISCAKNLQLPVKINHRENSIKFGGDVEGGAEGGTQESGQDHFRNQLMLIAQAMDKAIAVIAPKDIQEGGELMRYKILQAYKESYKKERLQVVHRRQVIEERKVQLESHAVQREREEQELADEQRRKQVQAEMTRLSKEAEERERQRKVDEHKDIQKKYMKEKLDQIRSTSFGAKALAHIPEDALANMDMDDILAKQVEQLEKEKKERDEKLRAQEKKVDYFERAKCIEEIPLLLEKHENERAAMKLFWEQTETERIRQLVLERELATSQKTRLLRMKEEQESFVSKMRSERHHEFKDKLKGWEKTYAEERKRMMQLRKEERKEERKLTYFRQKEEETIRRQEEEMMRQKEAKEAEVREKREKEMEEYQERKRKLDEMENKKRQKELEMESRGGEGKGGNQVDEGRGKKEEVSWRNKLDERKDDNFRERQRDDGSRRDDRNDFRRDDRRMDDRRDERRVDDRRDERRVDDRRDDRRTDERREGGGSWRKADDRNDDRRVDDRRNERRVDDRRDDRRVDDRDGRMEEKKDDWRKETGSSWRSQRTDEPRKDDKKPQNSWRDSKRT